MEIIKYACLQLIRDRLNIIRADAELIGGKTYLFTCRTESDEWFAGAAQTSRGISEIHVKPSLSIQYNAENVHETLYRQRWPIQPHGKYKVSTLTC